MFADKLQHKRLVKVVAVVEVMAVVVEVMVKITVMTMVIAMLKVKVVVVAVATKLNQFTIFEVMYRDVHHLFLCNSSKVSIEFEQ